MVKYREIIRLAAMGVSQRGIAYSCGCGQSTVSDVLRAARAHGVEWPLPEEMDDAAIRLAIYPEASKKAQDKADVDHERISAELCRRGMTMSLLWNEYCDDAVARGEKSSIARYLRIVGCETPVRLCISAFVSPWRLMSRILSIVGMSIILSASLPSSW